MSEPSHVIVGGGIAGIVTAYYLSKISERVVLIEKQKSLGGLLGSKLINGRYYDHGTHVLTQTGITELDDFLYTGLDYEQFPYLKYGSYAGSLYEGNGFISDSYLSDSVRKSCFSELIDRSINSEGHKTLEAQLAGSFGNGYYNELLKPVLQKLFFTDPANLTPNAHLLFGLSRIIAGSSEDIVDLKKDPRLDQLLAFHSYKDGATHLKSLYPNKGGVGSWISLLEKKLEKLGVTIFKGVDFEVSKFGNHIEYVAMGKEIKVDSLYWTVPPIFLYKSLGIEAPVVQPPKRLSSVIVDIECNGSINTDLYYFQVYDPDLKSFRVTFYDNFNETSDRIKRITVEFLSDDEDIDKNSYGELAIHELQILGVIDPTSEITAVNSDVVKGGFPVPTVQFKKDSTALIDGLSQLTNLKLLGKASGKSWFMNDVMREIHEEFSR